MEIITHNPQETEALGQKLGSVLKGGEVVAFSGEMGAGKTCFTRGLAKGLGFTGSVTSPTFALINEYLGGRKNLYHFDMYRISSWEDLYSSGFFEYKESGGVLAVEWSENISAALEQDTIYIDITKCGENDRKITITGVQLP